jgi:hypothetical protein
MCADIFAGRSNAAHQSCFAEPPAVLEKAENINPDPQIRIAALIRHQDGRSTLTRDIVRMSQTRK